MLPKIAAALVGQSRAGQAFTLLSLLPIKLATGGTGLFPQILEEFLDPGEEAFAFGVGVAVLAFLFEFAQQFLLALGQI